MPYICGNCQYGYITGLENTKYMIKSADKFQSPDPDERWISERIFVRETMNHPELAAVSLAQCRVPVGVTTQLHSLSIDEIYIIRSGSGMMEKNGGSPYAVSPGDCIYIPAGAAQRIRNSGDTDLIFDTLCMPRFDFGAYTDLESQGEDDDAQSEIPGNQTPLKKDPK